ncbi:type IV pilus modification protein PilV [Halieaceae bacterium IMCC8485]|jgi:type IV pilus assembly protein PilV|uniref:Type IV pilus modification protein PilV n=1 Tax=Candidatus Seongchinamella marina TaxID=2518990 RepID=A0ABT3SYK2_9GAMM|nr:type IV pilus modification protein PilV [Candidatus Seongchinamella marina]MCX2975069.1 type IV pilus modification protein PilV [Candidatus Seongchinamella marina]
MIRSPVSSSSRGFTLIEVLVTLLIISIGLLGLAGLQVTTLKSQLETYQRAQAILLVQDMVNRLRVNTLAARNGDYPNGSEYGLLDPDDICPADPLSATMAQNDLCEWNDFLAGTDVTLAGANQGSVSGARGCIENVVDTNFGEAVVRITVAWQGTTPTSAPRSDCGEDEYGDDDSFRRTFSLDAVLADLAL